jgi:ribosomal protein L11 methyltransferase
VDKGSETVRRHPETIVARLATDEANARRLADMLGETLDPNGAVVAAFEVTRGAWNVEIHFVQEPDRDAIRRLVTELAGDAVAGTLEFYTITPKDWVAASLAALKPVPAGRFVVHGAHDRDHIPVSHIAIEIEAALAFGTGHHGTTRGCLLAIDGLVKRRKPVRRRVLPSPSTPRRRRAPVEVLDVGTGTGILAIAAAQALRSRVRASDIDATSVAVARENARANRAAGRIDFIHADGLGDHRISAGAHYRIVLANILLPPLRRMASAMARLVAPGGYVILSGLLDEQAPAALAAYRAQGLTLRRRLSLEGWTTLILARTNRT